MAADPYTKNRIRLYIGNPQVWKYFQKSCKAGGQLSASKRAVELFIKDIKRNEARLLKAGVKLPESLFAK